MGAYNINEFICYFTLHVYHLLNKMYHFHEIKCKYLN